MVNDVIPISSSDRVLSKSMLLELDIAIREIENRLGSIELECKTYAPDKDGAVKIIQDISASITVQNKSVINNIMINNIEMKSMVFVIEIKDILDLLKKKIKYCSLLEDKE